MRLIIVFIISLPLFCFSQKQGDIWYFGSQSGFNLSSGTPVPLSNGMTGADTYPGNQEGTACISDSSGNLLFYTGGETIWDKNHSPMPNGSGLMGGTSSTQSSIIIPLPNSDSIFYVFTSDEFQSYPNGTEKGYRYSVVDMCLSYGNGDVLPTQKNISLLDSASEKLSACEDATGIGYWVMGHKMFSNEFRAWHLTAGGITNTVITKLGTLVGWDFSHSSWIYSHAQGQMKFNSSSTKLALAINSDPAVLDLLDFDANTGVVSNLCHMVIDSIFHKSIYGVEFSPDNSKLYAGVMGGFGGKRLYQFNLTAGGGNCDSIIASRKTLFQSNANSLMFGMQLATDGKIYLSCNSGSDLGRINFPNLSGLLADFDSSAIILSGINIMTPPSFIAGYKYHNQITPCKIATNIEAYTSSNKVLLSPNPFCNFVKINFDEQYSTLELKLFDLIGQVVSSASIKNHESLNLERAAPGIYFYQLTDRLTNKIIATGKIIKK